MATNYVDELMKCQKTIVSKPLKNMKTDQQNEFILRNQFSCVSEDGQHQFEVFMRCHVNLRWIFSIGLRYKAELGTITICRYNGKHEHRNKIINHERFEGFHIHKLQDEQLSDDSSNSLDAELTRRYISFNEALYAFLSDCNIQDWQKYFPGLEMEINQLTLEEE